MTLLSIYEGLSLKDSLEGAKIIGSDAKRYVCQRFCELSPKQQGYVRGGLWIGGILLVSSICGCISQPQTVHSQVTQHMAYVYSDADVYLATHGGGNLSDYDLIPISTGNADILDQAGKMGAIAVVNRGLALDDMSMVQMGDALVPKNTSI